VRLANRRYPEMLGSGLTSKLRRLKLQCIDHIPNVPGINFARLQQLMESQPLQRLLQNEIGRLAKCFELFAKEDKGHGTSGTTRGRNKELHKASTSGQMTMNIIEFESFCTDGGMIDGRGQIGASLSKNDARHAFVEVNVDDDLWEQADAANTSDELLFDEFQETLVLLALRGCVVAAEAAASAAAGPGWERLPVEGKTFDGEKVAAKLEDMLYAVDDGIYDQLAAKHKQLRSLAGLRRAHERLDVDEGAAVPQRRRPRTVTTVMLENELASWHTRGRRAAGMRWLRLPHRSACQQVLRQRQHGGHMRDRGGSRAGDPSRQAHRAPTLVAVPTTDARHPLNFQYNLQRSRGVKPEIAVTSTT
jgi:hypothetical protein